MAFICALAKGRKCVIFKRILLTIGSWSNKGKGGGQKRGKGYNYESDSG